MQMEFEAKQFGSELHRCRLALGWTAKQLALLYSESIGREEDPIDVSFIYRLEAGKDMLVDKGRRALLARLVDMPVTAAGLGLLMSEAPTNPFVYKKVDTEEYATTLINYCDMWSIGTTYKATKDIKKRVHSLERASLYSSSSEKAKITELLCAYQILAADVASEQAPNMARPILSQAIVLAKQENIYNTHAHALRQRAGISIDIFEQTRKQDAIKQAVSDFQASEIIQRRISPFYQGIVDVRRGLAYAYVACDQYEFTKALNIIDSASKQIGKQSGDKYIAARLDEERYRFNRASAYLHSPQGSPKSALFELDQAVDAKPETSPRRGVHRELLFAETYIALGNYPMAVAHADAAVEISSVHAIDTLLNRLENVYHVLRSSSYGNNQDVARLGVHLLKAQQPELFV